MQTAQLGSDMILLTFRDNNYFLFTYSLLHLNLRSIVFSDVEHRSHACVGSSLMFNCRLFSFRNDFKNFETVRVTIILHFEIL